MAKDPVGSAERSKKQDSKHLLSPYVRVPVLWHDGRPVYESSIINEYLEEIAPSPTLLPEDAGRRALARFWIDFCNTRFMPTYFNLLKERNPELRTPLQNVLAGHLQFIETMGLANVSRSEPYWMGDAGRLCFLSVFRAVRFRRNLSRHHHTG